MHHAPHRTWRRSALRRCLVALAAVALLQATASGPSAAYATAQGSDGLDYAEKLAEPFGAEVAPSDVEFDFASTTLGIDPSAVTWIALTSSPELVDSATGRSGDEPPDGVLDLLPVGVNDYVLVTVTSVDTSETTQVVVDANDAYGGATSNQAIIFGSHPSVVSVVQIDFSTDPVTYFTAAEPESGGLDEFFTANGAGDYRFDLSFRNQYSTEAGHQEIWLVGEGPGIGPAGSAGRSTLIFVVGGAAAVAVAAAALAARARRRRGPSPAPAQRPGVPEQVIVQLSAERLDISTSQGATLTVMGWVAKQGSPPQRADVSLAVVVPPDAGVVVSPATGLGELVADVHLEALPKNEEAQLTVTGAYGTARGQASVMVGMKVDYELQLF